TPGGPSEPCSAPVCRQSDACASRSTCQSPHCNQTDAARGPTSGWQEEPRTPLPSRDASEDPPRRRGQRRVPERPAALPRWRRESRPETPSAESPWDGYAEDPDGRLAGGTPPALLEREPEEAAAATAPVSASQEPTEQEAAAVLTRNDAGTPAPAQRTAAAPRSAPSDAGTPAPAERTAQGQGKAPGSRVAQRETHGPRAARPEVRGPCMARPQAPGPRSAQQGSPETVPVRRESLQEKDRQVTVAEPPGQSEIGTPARDQEKVWKRWSRGNPTRR